MIWYGCAVIASLKLGPSTIPVYRITTQHAYQKPAGFFNIFYQLPVAILSKPYYPLSHVQKTGRIEVRVIV